MAVDKIKFYGYDNYAEADAYISELNGTTYNSTEYVFPAKDANGTAQLTSHTIEFADQPATRHPSSSPLPVSNVLLPSLSSAKIQPAEPQPSRVRNPSTERAIKQFKERQFLLYRDGTWYNLSGQIVEKTATTDK